MTEEAKPSSTSQSKTNRSLLVALIASAVVAVGFALWAHHRNEQAAQIAKSKQAISPAKVTIAASGFEPATIQVKPGTQVTWTNSDTAVHQVAADPYPKNDSIPGFNSTVVLHKNDGYSFTFAKAGTYTYHDQKNPLKLHGTVVVK